MKIIGIDHIGIAVTKIENSYSHFQKAFDLPLAGVENIPDRYLQIGFLEIGNTRIELIESTSPESAIARFIAKRGEGIHHICILVENIDEVLAHFKKRGLQLIDEDPRAGAEGSRIAFVHPSTFGGILIELKEKPVSTKAPILGRE